MIASMMRRLTGLTPSAKRSLAIGLSIGAVVAVLDQLSKTAILARLGGTGLRLEVLPFVDFVLTWNRGVSFSLGNNDGPYNAILFAGLAVVIGGVLVGWMAKSVEPLILVALGLVVGGAAGNLVDRLRFGAVVDFLYVHIGRFDWWPVFNLADSAICVGATLMVIDSLFGKHDSHMNSP